MRRRRLALISLHYPSSKRDVPSKPPNQYRESRSIFQLNKPTASFTVGSNLEMAARSFVPPYCDPRLLSTVSATTLITTAARYLPTFSRVNFGAPRCVTWTTGFGEPGGDVVDRERGLRVSVPDFEAGDAGGGMPLMSAALEMLCDLDPCLRRAIVGCEEPAMSGSWSGWITVVASSTRSFNMETEDQIR